MCRKMKRKRTIIAMICVIAISVFNVVPASACTPKLNPPSVKIPDITIQIDDQLNEAISNTAQKFVENNVLATPGITDASYMHKESRYWSYGILNVKWDPIENATSYDVCITKEDGTEKVFTTTYNSLFASNIFDDFVADGIDGATVKVKAYGDGDKFSLWSDEVIVSRFDF